MVLCQVRANRRMFIGTSRPMTIFLRIFNIFFRRRLFRFVRISFQQAYFNSIIRFYGSGLRRLFSFYQDNFRCGLRGNLFFQVFTWLTTCVCAMDTAFIFACLNYVGRIGGLTNRVRRSIVFRIMLTIAIRRSGV